MFKKRFSFKSIFALFALTLLLLSATAPAFAYDYGPWNMDGYFKSNFGLFTEGKPFNKSDRAGMDPAMDGTWLINNTQNTPSQSSAGSNDNIATARQQLRWNINGQVSNVISVRAEVLGAWEPSYTGEKGTGEFGGQLYIHENYYSSFDWRELTVEYKPTYSHTLRFGRQIVNWGEAVSGRVLDQCNPVDSRYLLGFTNLEETYMPLWMLRGIHDFSDINSSFEWIVAPIWQSNRFEVSRSMTVSGTRFGDGKTWGAPWYRYGANPEGRVSRYSGAEMLIKGTDGSPARIYGPPFADGYHGTDLLATTDPRYTAPGTAIQPLTSIEADNASFLYPWTIPNAYHTISNKNILWTEYPSTDGSLDKRYPYDYADHNFKNSRWGIKTKSVIGGIEGGFSFYQAPALSGTYHYKDRRGLHPAAPNYGYLIYEYVIPRENTFGLYGNYQFPWAIVSFEGAYKPSREYQKDLYGLAPGRSNSTPDANGNYAVNDATNQARLNNIAEKDLVHTLLGVTREQNIPLLNKYNVFTLRGQWSALWALENMDDVVETTTYWNEQPQIDHEFTVSISTAYSYRKYNPSLTFVVNPRGQLYSSAAFTYVPGGFNDRLNLSIGYTNIWGANAYSTRTVFAAKNDLAVLTLQYNFY